MDAFDRVEPVFQTIFARVWARGAEDLGMLAGLTPVERAVYATRIVEGQIENGGWYQAFFNDVDHLIEPAIEGYELLDLAEHAEHFRHVRAIGFTADTPQPIGEALDDEYFRLSDAEAARAAALTRSG